MNKNKFKKEFSYKGNNYIVTIKSKFGCLLVYRIYQKTREQKHCFDFLYKTLITNSATTIKTVTEFKKEVLQDIDSYYKKLQNQTDVAEWLMDKNSKF